MGSSVASALRRALTACGFGPPERHVATLLDALGIVSLEVTAIPLDVTTPQGARLTGYGDVTFAGGTVRRMFDAVLRSNDTDTKFAGEGGAASWQDGLTLDAKGFGRITDLSVAMANDVAFGELAASTVAAMGADSASRGGADLRTLVAQAGDVLDAWGAALELTREPMAARGAFRVPAASNDSQGSGREAAFMVEKAA